MDYQQVEVNSSVSHASDEPVKLRRTPNRYKPVYSTYVKNKRLSRYKNAFQSLAPFNIKKTDTLSVQNSGLFSFMTFTWILKYLWDSFTNNVDMEKPKCPQPEESCLNSSRLHAFLKDKMVEKGGSVPMIHVIWDFIKTRTIFSCILFFISTITSLSGIVFFIPQILVNKESGAHFLIYLMITELTAYLLHSWSNAINLRTSVRVRSACFAALFRHTIITSLTYKLSSWQIVSFLLPEGQQIHELIMSIPYLICTPVIIICCIGFAGYELYLWGFMSVIIILLFFPILLIVTLISKQSLFKATIFSDKRIKLLEDFIINNMYVKYFKKEDDFKNKIEDIRRNELMCMKKVSFYDNFCFSFIQNQSVLSLAALFIAYHLTHSIDKKISLQAQIAAVCILMMIHLKYALDNFWSALSNFTKGLLSLKKVKELLILEEIETRTLKPPTNFTITLNNASFERVIPDNIINKNDSLKFNKKNKLQFPFEYSSQDVISKIDMYIPKGSMIGICGESESGKTSLLLAIMGLLRKTNGHRLVDGEFAYVSEDAIIFDKSLKDNILFGKDFNSNALYRVLYHCFLNEFDDFEKIIDSKSLTLEQRQRIVLARALYSDKDIYLLDNPLSALDIRTLEQIFENCIINSLHEKTRVLVTNNPMLLEKCDLVYLMENGLIKLHGSYNSLLNNEDFISFINDAKKENIKCERFNPFGMTGDNPSCPKNVGHLSASYTIFESVDSLNADSVDGQEMSASYSNYSTSLGNVVKLYLKNFRNIQSIFGLIMTMGNGIFISILPILFIITLKNSDYIEYFLLEYFVLFIIMLLFSTVINYFFNSKIFSSAAHFHGDILNKIFNASLRFFQMKSLGIISTISLHLNLTDNEIPRLIYGSLNNCILIFFSFWIICLISYWNIIPFVILITVMIISLWFTRNALLNINLFQIESINNLYKHVVTILTARPIIQAYNQIDMFTQKLYEDYDKYVTYSYMINAAKGWLTINTQFFSVCFLISVCAIPQIFQLIHDDTIHNMINTALVIVCVYQICIALQKFSVLFIDLSIGFNTLSLIDYFKQTMEEEVKNSQVNFSIDNAYNISFKNVTIGSIYTDDILENVSFSIKDKEKMGFLGLTYNEKNAIVSALYRLKDINNGSILIGSQNIKDISIQKLRSIISVIPSESHLFDDTIKKILNPDKISHDDLLIEVLNNFGLWDSIKKSSKKLETSVNALSQRERQLLLLAQAYLQQTPIIIIEDFISGSQIDQILKHHINEYFQNSIVIVFGNDIDCLKCCNYVTLFENGKVTAVDETDKIIQSNIPTHLKRMKYMSNVPETVV